MSKKIILFIAQICLILFNPIASKEYSPDASSTMLHFINTGSSDAILIESIYIAPFIAGPIIIILIIEMLIVTGRRRKKKDAVDALKKEV